MRGSVSLLKRDSSGNELSNNWQQEGQLYLITKCRDKVIDTNLISIENLYVFLKWINN